MENYEADADYGNRYTAEVLATTAITPEGDDEVREIQLRIEAPAFDFLVGQNIGVLVPGPHPFGNPDHHRYYSIADTRERGVEENAEIEILVRRCFYIDEVSGERYPGIASNYLCDAAVGDRLTITGPYRSAFRIPSDPSSNLLMIGTGTGIAPFRSLVKAIYRDHGRWHGKVCLFYGARNGFELLYMNDQNNDFSNYYDRETFQAFQAIGSRPLRDAGDALADSLRQNAEQAWALLQDPKTQVVLAGLKKRVAAFDKQMAITAGSEERWKQVKRQIMDEKRWQELTYS